MLAIDPIERRLGGRAGGILFVIAGISAATYPLLPGSIHGHLGWLYLIATVSFVWGTVTLVAISIEATLTSANGLLTIVPVTATDPVVLGVAPGTVEPANALVIDSTSLGNLGTFAGIALFYFVLTANVVRALLRPETTGATA